MKLKVTTIPVKVRPTTPRSSVHQKRAKVEIRLLIEAWYSSREEIPVKIRRQIQTENQPRPCGHRTGVNKAEYAKETHR